MKTVFFFLAALVAFGQTANDLVQRANATTDPNQKLALLRQAIAVDDSSSAAHYVMGATLLDLGRFAEAATHFARAKSRADSKPAAALALRGWGEALFRENKLDEAMVRLKQSIEQNRTARAEELLTAIMAKRGQQPMNYKEITRALEAEAPDLGGAPVAIDLVINFDNDQDILRPEGRQQAMQLAVAIKGLPGKRFVVIGHTDRHGSEAHNQDLSERRAKRVVAFLVEQGVPGSSLRWEGHGKRQLLNTQETPVADAANRRVEVQVATN